MILKYLIAVLVGNGSREICRKLGQRYPAYQKALRLCGFWGVLAAFLAFTPPFKNEPPLAAFFISCVIFSLLFVVGGAVVFALAHAFYHRGPHLPPEEEEKPPEKKAQ